MVKREQILEALTYALQNINSQIQVILLAEIVDYLPQDLKEEVVRQTFVAVKSIRSNLKCLPFLSQI